MKEIMKIRKDYKLELATSKNEKRFAIEQIMIAKRDGKFVAVATDGRQLAMVPIEMDDNDTIGPIRPESLAKARKETGRELVQATMTLHKDYVTFSDGVTYPRPDVQYPKLEGIMPYKDECTTFVCALNPNLLSTLARAIGAKNVVLRFKSNCDAILVEPVEHDNEAVGALMPVRMQ